MDSRLAHGMVSNTIAAPCLFQRRDYELKTCFIEHLVVPPHLLQLFIDSSGGEHPSVARDPDHVSDDLGNVIEGDALVHQVTHE